MKLYDEHAAEIATNSIPVNVNTLVSDYLRYAYFLATTHRDEEGAEFVRKAALHAKRVTDPAASAETLYRLAVAQARLGDTAGYRATCTSLVELPLDSTDYLTNSRPIWTPCLAPNALDDLKLQVARAEEYSAKIPPGERHWGLYLLGAAHFRAGQYELAAKSLQESIDAYPTRPRPGADTINYQQLLLAMSQWQLDRHDAARRLLAETIPDVEKELQSPAIGWNRRATLEILRSEAEALIEQETSDEARINANPAVSSVNPEH
jgi:tetratricopeptide (TPR) repeat protein